MNCAKDFWKRHSCRHSESVYKVTTYTAMGNKKEKEYWSASEIAREIVDCLDERGVKSLIAHVCVDDRGTILVSTRSHLDFQIINGKHLCSTCGYYFKGARGLRIHQILAHGVEYGEAQKEALESEYQIVVYSADDNLLNKWLFEAKEAENVKNSIVDGGLRAAKDGDLLTLQQLVLDGWDINTRDKNGCNALSWARYIIVLTYFFLSCTKCT